MAQPSPSEFLTFYRTVTRAATRGQSVLARRPRLVSTATRPISAAPSFAASSARTFSSMAARLDEGRQDDAGKRTMHSAEGGVLEREGYDPQAEAARKSKADHDAGTGGNATARRDQTRSTERAKKEHSEAPDVIIGMQDERGQKGH